MSLWICPPPCRVKNRDQDARCEECGTPRPAGQAANKDGASCPFDGSPLHANGWCEVGNGYPITRSCTFVCDRCRQRLTWAGTCLSCDRYAPGDRYEYDSEKGGLHWQLTEKGPFALLSLQQNAHMAAEFQHVMANIGQQTSRSRATAHPDSEQHDRSMEAQAELARYRDWLGGGRA